MRIQNHLAFYLFYAILQFLSNLRSCHPKTFVLKLVIVKLVIGQLIDQELEVLKNPDVPLHPLDLNFGLISSIFTAIIEDFVVVEEIIAVQLPLPQIPSYSGP